MALSAPPIERKRVKVYELRENDWFDRGTGFCTTQCILEEGRIFVESEEDSDRILLEVKIKKEDVYQKQQDTLIVWTDNDGVDMALSFQEAEGCSAVWSSISTAQERPPTESDALPSPDLGNLPHLEDILRRANQTQLGRDSMSKMIIQENYILKLIPLVETAEDLESLNDLHRLCNIMKTLILYNDTSIIEHVVRDDIILGVVGALEYDPDFPMHKANHRQYLSDESKFKEVVPIQDPDVKRKIHFTYRLQYLKDVVLARILDDPTFSVLNSLIFFHQVDIVQHIQSNAPYLREVFGLITSPDAPAQKRKDAVLFIQQSCAIAKNLQAPSRNALYQNLIGCGLFSTITFALQHQDAAVRVAGTDILVAVIDHDALMMRNQVIKAINEKTKPMTETLIELLLIETDFGVKQQIGDAIKVLLDPNTNAGGPGERPMGQENNYMSKLRGNITSAAQSDSFLQHFYEHSAKVLFQPLKDLERRSTLDGLSNHEMSTFVILIEILCFFIRQHNYRGKYYILAENFHQRVAQLLSCPQKHLKLSAIKYFRSVIGIRDEFHERQIMQFKLFAPILDIIISTMPRDNLLNSAVLELFEFIRKESLKAVIYHLVEQYRERLSTITHVDIFQGIILRYDQYINPPPEEQQSANADSSFMTSEADTPNTRNVTINGAGTRWQGLRDTNPDEEAYFDASDEDDEEDELSRDQPSPHRTPNGLAASPIAKPLVDYGDDDDEPNGSQGNGALASPLTKSDELPSPSPTSSPTPTTTPNTPLSSTSPPDASNAAQTTPSRPPPPKRLRPDDDDDDELQRLSSGVKRRNSSTSTASSRAGSITRSNSKPAIVHNAAKRSSSPVANVDDWELIDPGDAQSPGSNDTADTPMPDKPTEETNEDDVEAKPATPVSSKKTPTTPIRQSTRRTRASAGKDSNGGVETKTRKISISLSGGGAKKST